MSPKLKITEKAIQSALFEWLRWKAKANPLYSLFFAIPNGAHLANGAISFRSLHSQGLEPGVPDIFGAVPFEDCGQFFHGLFIELKTETGKIQEKQLEWIEKLRAQQFKVSVCRSFDDAKNTIEFTIKRHKI